MSKLKKLNISGNCRVADKGISNLNLEELNVSYNPRITTFNHMTKLKNLNIAGYSFVIGNGDKIYIYLEELKKLNILCHDIT